MPDVAFEYKKLFKGAKLEEVYDAVLEWVRERGAKVKKADRPELISILYGREDVPWNWDRELKRTVDFEFVTSPDYVGIGVYQAPVRKTAKRVLESPFQANITWQDWLNECWDYVAKKVVPEETKGPRMRVPTAKAAARPMKGAMPPPRPSAGAPPPPKPSAPPPPPKARETMPEAKRATPPAGGPPPPPPPKPGAKAPDPPKSGNKEEKKKDEASA